MDPETITLLVNGLGPGLAYALGLLADKLAAEAGFEPLKDLLRRGWDKRQDAEGLSEAVLAAIDGLLASDDLELPERLFTVPHWAGLKAEAYQLMAAAAVEMTRPDPRKVPAGLLAALGLEEGQRGLLARFLFLLRQKLGASKLEGYRNGIQYADRLEDRGLLSGLAEQVSVLSIQAKRLVSIEEALIADRRLSTDEAQALRDYLNEVRPRWEDLMLPLIRKRSGEAARGRLKQVFVPLSLRDRRAEEEAHRRMERRARQAARQALAQEEQEQARPVAIGELLNRYPQFILIGPPGCGKSTLLHRLALAFAEGRAAEDLGWQGQPLLPILLRLRNFGVFLKERRGEYPQPACGALIAYLENLYRSGERIALTPGFFDRRLEEGGCLILMDGLDEVAENRAEVAQHACAFILDCAAKGNRFGLASRPRGYEAVEWQLRPAGLAVAEVNPLEPQGIHQLIENLLGLVEADPGLRAKDIHNLDRAILGSVELTQLAGIPLFCSALVQVYKYHGAELPQRRVDVFDEVVDLLLGFWRAAARYLSAAEELAMEDGTGRTFPGVKEAVAVKQRRLSYLAAAMQRRRQAEIEDRKAARLLACYLMANERVKDPDTAQTWAENFLVNSHERSGLLVEHDPEKYAFLHKGFMEFLAATALVNRSKTLVKTVLARAGDDWWEQVILLAGAHPRLAEDLRSELVNSLLDRAESLRRGSEEWQRDLLLSSRLARDMADYLPGPEHQRVEDALHAAMTDPALKPTLRAEAADALDALGWLPADLYELVEIRPKAEGGGMKDEKKIPPSSFIFHPFWIARYPVTNAQYARFLQAEDFADPELWRGFPRFDERSRAMGGDWGEAGWGWLQAALANKERSPDGVRVPPRYWNDPRFGMARQGAPLVGVTWYEASAYCRWLLRHWRKLEEGQANPDLAPGLVRLPLETEWAAAAGGEQPEGRYPWDASGVATRSEAEILARANVDESQIGRTTPVGMYPHGVSRPHGLWDLAGNVWEWQGNYYDRDHDFLALRGGSWSSLLERARVAGRGSYHPDYYGNHYGFRVVALPRDGFVS